MKNYIKLKGDVTLVNKDELIESEVKYQEPKQETLEEAAKNYFNNFTKRKEEFAFIDGAKWQQEQEKKKIIIDETLVIKTFPIKIKL